MMEQTDSAPLETVNAPPAVHPQAATLNVYLVPHAQVTTQSVVPVPMRLPRENRVLTPLVSLGTPSNAHTAIATLQSAMAVVTFQDIIVPRQVPIRNRRMVVVGSPEAKVTVRKADQNPRPNLAASHRQTKARERPEADETGRAKFTLEGRLMDQEGNHVATSIAHYRVRKRGFQAGTHCPPS